jgi:GNAT superfamily N-acetyltransferase
MAFTLENNFDIAVRIMREAGQWYEDKGLEPYPSWRLENLNPDALSELYGGKGNFYIIKSDSIPVAALILKDSDVYDTWREEGLPDIPATYVHKFSVGAEWRGKIHWPKVVWALKAFARDRGHRMIRIDFDPTLPKHGKFYARLGFKHVKTVMYQRIGMQGALYEMGLDA